MTTARQEHEMDSQAMQPVVVSGRRNTSASVE
jgi:hypothetical protein